MQHFDKKNFLDYYLMKQKDLGKSQREYKKVLNTKLQTRNETIIDATYQNTIDQARLEKNDLKAQLWVAGGVQHSEENQRHLTDIKCHVNCQEHLSADIRKLKTEIFNMEREISRVDKQTYELNRKIVPNQQHLMHVAHTRKKMHILENQLEVSVRRECSYSAQNADLRDELIRMLKHRTFFNDSYSKLVQKLNIDKKYLIDLIEYTLGTFDKCIDVYEKINNNVKRVFKERELRKKEMQGIMRKVAAETYTNEFLGIKHKPRVLADLLPKEIRRRAKFRRRHDKKISLYNHILDKIFDYTESHNMGAVISKFQEQESLYYSYFNYANEISYHMTLLNNCVNRLYIDINGFKANNRNSLQKQLDTISELEKILKEKQNKNLDLKHTCLVNDRRLENLLQGLEAIFEICHGNSTPLMLLLGDNTHISLANVRKYIKILEIRISELVACVYVMERKKYPNAGYYVVKQIEKYCDAQTPLENIVLTQQCPECAEGEDFNMDDAVEVVTIHTLEQVKKRQYEKVIQPEMQYRLHSIHDCRLPRSHVLAAKANA